MIEQQRVGRCDSSVRLPRGRADGHVDEVALSAWQTVSAVLAHATCCVRCADEMSGQVPSPAPEAHKRFSSSSHVEADPKQSLAQVGHGLRGRPSADTPTLGGATPFVTQSTRPRRQHIGGVRVGGSGGASHMAHPCTNLPGVSPKWCARPDLQPRRWGGEQRSLRSSVHGGLRFAGALLSKLDSSGEATCRPRHLAPWRAGGENSHDTDASLCKERVCESERANRRRSKPPLAKERRQQGEQLIRGLAPGAGFIARPHCPRRPEAGWRLVP